MRMHTVDQLAQEIRRIDGANTLGAGALAEALMPFFATPSLPPQGEAQARKVGTIGHIGAGGPTLMASIGPLIAAAIAPQGGEAKAGESLLYLAAQAANAVYLLTQSPHLPLGPAVCISLEEIRMQLNAAIAAQALPVADTASAGRDVLAERERQKSGEGWTPEHDDEHSGAEMVDAAICYAQGYPSVFAGGGGQRWPWLHGWWKPATKRRNLVKAAALLVAEIERIDRTALQQTQGSGA